MKLKLFCASLIAAMVFGVVSVFAGESFETKKVYVSSASEIEVAMRTAVAGDEIIIAPGTYELTRGHTKGALAYSESEGTKDKHIIVRSEDPENPAVLSGSDTSTRYLLYVTGDYWEIRDLKICTARKGIVIDNSNYTVIDNCEVYNIGEEGIHLRDGSCNNIVSNCYVHDTGLLNPGYGEGIYVGSYYGETNYSHEVHNNIITHCILGPNIAAEHIDIKEYTTGTIVEYCTMYGRGISAANYADSFMDVKGNNAIIRFNNCYRQNNTNLIDAFQVHCVVNGWGKDNVFYGNNFNADDDTQCAIVNAQEKDVCSARYYGNTRNVPGTEYIGRCIYDETLAKYMITPDPGLNSDSTSDLTSDTNSSLSSDPATTPNSDPTSDTTSNPTPTSNPDPMPNPNSDSEYNSSPTSKPDTIKYELGDINNDGQIDIIDVVVARAHIVGNNTLSQAAIYYGDINGDNAVDISDVVVMRSMIVNK